MSATRINFFCNFILLLSYFRGAVSVKKGYYTIIAPQYVRRDSAFHVSFTLNDFHKSCWFNITFTNYKADKELLKVDGIEIKPRTTKLVQLQIPASYSGVGYLYFTGYSGIINKEKALLVVRSEPLWAFIQTNKQKYKPGELVKFRVICIDQLKRPANVKEIITVKIYDHEDNLIFNIIDVKLVQGVLRSEFQLSDHPVLGVWIVKFDIGNLNLAVKHFEVDRYEFPDFNVKILTKNAVVIDEGEITMEINASYFYGEPVKGNLTFLISCIGTPNHKVPLPPTLSQETQIDGRKTYVKDLIKDLLLKKEDHWTNWDNSYRFLIEATVTDAISEKQFYTATQIEVQNQLYTVWIDATRTFRSDPIINIEVEVNIKDVHENFIEDSKTPIEIIIGCNQRYLYDGDFDVTRIQLKKQFEKDFAAFNITNKNYMLCYLYAEYQGCKSLKAWMRSEEIELKLDILTQSPTEGEELEIKITSPLLEPIEEFSYEIQSREDIIQSGHVNVPGNQTTYILRLNVTFAMVPKITVYIHHIQNMSLRGSFVDAIVKRAFYNSIEIQTENETNPGSLVNINVTTDEGSYVGLMGLDRRVLESIKKEDILNGDSVNFELNKVNRRMYRYFTKLHGGPVGDITVLSNLFPPIDVPVVHGVSTVPRIRTRSLFPESWLYIDFESTPEGGLNLLETVPDSITTWAITGFSIHPDTGLTFTKNATNLKVFQEFFIEMDFPTLVREDEIIEIPIYINNYLDQDALTNVTIESNNADLDILLDYPVATGSKSNFNFSRLISGNNRVKLLVFLKPLKQGQYNVTVKAINSVASDAIQKTLNVQPQGITYAMSKKYLVHLPKESIQEDEITIDIPEDAVSESQRIEVSVAGDIFRPLMEKLQKLARVPYGNGEDNMRLIVSNLIILKYLKTLSYSDSILENKIRFNLELGYQNQLSFKYLDGSFGLVERRIGSRTGDIWQTMLALWGLQKAKDFIHVDPDVIERGLNYLQSKQEENGCFKSESGREDDVKFTAFCLIMLLMDEHSREAHNEVISRGLEFLYEMSDDLEYSSISVMSTYALILGKHEKSESHLKKLASNSRLTDKQKLWENSDTLQSHIETTAESLMELFESQEIPEQSLLQIVRGLIISKNEEVSVTHMIALDTMIAFVEKLSLGKKNINIDIKDDQNKSAAFRVNGENSQVLQTFEISESSRKMKIQNKGQGFAVVDVRYQYNIVPEDQSSSFFTTNTSTKRTSKFLGVLKICSSILKTENQNKLTIMEVNLQSGYVFTKEDFSEDRNLVEDIKSVQINGGKDKALVYIEFISNETCIELEIRKTNNVFNSKPGWVFVYEANDEKNKAAKSFEINEF